MKRFLSIPLALIFLLAVIFIAMPKSAPPAPEKAAADIASEATETLPDEKFDAEEARLVAVMAAQDPREAIQTLKDDMETDPSMTASCHELLHALGRTTYKKYQDFGKAMQYQDDFCVSGYIHGAMEEYFNHVKDLHTALQTVCDGYAAHSYSRWQCVHGVGHGLMFASGNDLPGSLQRCATYADAADERACANGAYMENFNADQVEHVSIYIDPERPLYPCDEAKKNRLECFMNLPIQYLLVHQNDYPGASKLCDSAPEADRGNCYLGIGAQATRRNIDNPALVEEVCSLSDAWHANCIGGSVSGYIGHYVSSTLVLGICDTFTVTDRDVCTASVRLMQKTYPGL